MNHLFTVLEVTTTNTNQGVSFYNIPQIANGFDPLNSPQIINVNI